jgi:hypothetical protein
VPRFFSILIAFVLLLSTGYLLEQQSRSITNRSVMWGVSELDPNANVTCLVGPCGEIAMRIWLEAQQDRRIAAVPLPPRPAIVPADRLPNNKKSQAN